MTIIVMFMRYEWIVTVTMKNGTIVHRNDWYEKVEKEGIIL